MTASNDGLAGGVLWSHVDASLACTLQHGWLPGHSMQVWYLTCSTPGRQCRLRCSPPLLHAVLHHQEGATAVGQVGGAVLDGAILLLVNELLHLGVHAGDLDGGLLAVVAVLKDVLVDLRGSEGGR